MGSILVVPGEERDSRVLRFIVEIRTARPDGVHFNYFRDTDGAHRCFGKLACGVSAKAQFGLEIAQLSRGWGVGRHNRGDFLSRVVVVFIQETFGRFVGCCLHKRHLRSVAYIRGADSVSLRGLFPRVRNGVPETEAWQHLDIHAFSRDLQPVGDMVRPASMAHDGMGHSESPLLMRI
jgi:hypothetical protein